ncbi:MAG: hypothetical protein RL591_615 [Planctomycetota bacterium]
MRRLDLRFGRETRNARALVVITEDSKVLAVAPHGERPRPNIEQILIARMTGPMRVRERWSRRKRETKLVAESGEVVCKPLESPNEVHEQRAIRRTDERRLRCNVRMVERDRRVNETAERKPAEVDACFERTSAQIRITAGPCRNEAIERIPHEGEGLKTGEIGLRDPSGEKRATQAHDIEMLQIVRRTSDRAKVFAHRAAVQMLAILDSIVAVHAERAFDTRTAALRNMDEHHAEFA